MTQTPPVDQRIVDEYFQLASHRHTKDIAWLYGMVATYGLKPDELCGFTWSHDNSIQVPSKKRQIRPLHPQWVLLFALKEKQPQDLWSCWSSLCSSLYRAIAYQDISVNITDLLLAHRIRKSFCRQFKQQRVGSPAYAGAS
jgi:hypothetical protein